jgi:transposase
VVPEARRTPAAVVVRGATTREGQPCCRSTFPLCRRRICRLGRPAGPYLRGGQRTSALFSVPRTGCPKAQASRDSDGSHSAYSRSPAKRTGLYRRGERQGALPRASRLSRDTIPRGRGDVKRSDSVFSLLRLLGLHAVFRFRFFILPLWPSAGEAWGRQSPPTPRSSTREQESLSLRPEPARTKGSALYPRIGAGAVRAIAPRPGPPSSPAFRLAPVAPRCQAAVSRREGRIPRWVPGVPACKAGVRLLDPAGYPSVPRWRVSVFAWGA